MSVYPRRFYVPWPKKVHPSPEILEIDRGVDDRWRYRNWGGTEGLMRPGMDDWEYGNRYLQWTAKGVMARMFTQSGGRGAYNNKFRGSVGSHEGRGGEGGYARSLKQK